MESYIQEFLTLLIQFFLAATAALAPLLLLEVKKFVKARLTAGQVDMVTRAVDVAVYAAEQLGLSGEEAKQKAIDLAEQLLAKQGIVIELDQLADLIEAAVFENLNYFKGALEEKKNVSSR